MTGIAGALRSWGREPSPVQLELLEQFGAWLREEAVPAGGLGESEAIRVEERHLLDSLAFLQGIEDVPASLVDAGSGVGLPGIPLAIMLPETAVRLVDRSGRRVRLARRAVRVLGLENVSVHQGDITGLPCDVLTMRAVMDPARACRLVGAEFPRSRAVLAITRGGPTPVLDLPEIGSHSLRLIDGGAGILDPAPWLLIMAPT